MQQIYRRTPCRSVISIKLKSNFIEITLRHGFSPVNLLHIFRILFPKNTCVDIVVGYLGPYRFLNSFFPCVDWVKLFKFNVNENLVA